MEPQNVLIPFQAHPEISENREDVQFTNSLVRQLCGEGVHVDYLGVFTRSVRIPGCSFYSMSSKKTHLSGFIAIIMARLLFLPIKTPDVVHIQEPFMALPFFLLMPGVPVVLTMHRGSVLQDEHCPKKGVKRLLFQWKKKLEALCYAHCTWLVPTNEEVLQETRVAHPAAIEKLLPRTIVMGTFFDSVNFYPGTSNFLQQRLGHDNYYFVCTDPHVHASDVGYLIQLWGTLFQKQHNCILVLTGVGPLKEQLEAYAQQVCQWNRPRFLGPVTTEHEGDILRSADAMVTVAEQGPDGAKVKEALACSTPVVAAKGDEGTSLVQEGRSGFVVERDMDIIARTLGRVAQGEVSRESVEQAFRAYLPGASEGAVTQQYLKVYQNAMWSKGGTQ